MDIPAGWSQIPTEGAEIANQWNQSRLGDIQAAEAYALQPTAISSAKTKLGQEQTALASSQIDLQNKELANPIVQMQTYEAALAQGAASIDPNDPKAADRWSKFIQKQIDAGNPVAEQWRDYSPAAMNRLASAYSAASPVAQQSALGAQPFQSAIGATSGYGPGQTPPGGAPTAPIDYAAHFATLQPPALQALGTKLEGIKAGLIAVQNSPNPVATFNQIAGQLGHPEWQTANPQEVAQHVQMLAQQIVPAAQAYEAYTSRGSLGLPQPQQAIKTENVGGNVVGVTPQGAVAPLYEPSKFTVDPYGRGPNGEPIALNTKTGDFALGPAGSEQMSRSGGAAAIRQQVGEASGLQGQALLDYVAGTGKAANPQTEALGKLRAATAMRDADINAAVNSGRPVTSVPPLTAYEAQVDQAMASSAPGPVAKPAASAPAGLPQMKVGALHDAALAALQRATTPEQKTAIKARYAQYKSDDGKPLPALP